MIFGIAKEIKNSETRVGILPDQAKELVGLGNEVLFETGAGALCGHPDEEYIAAGVKIVGSMEEIYAKSDVVIGIKELEKRHYALLREGLTIVTCFHSNAHPDEVDEILKHKITGIAWEDMSDGEGNYPILKAQSQMAGAGAALMGAYHLSAPGGGKGIMLANVTGGPVPRVTILGCGASGIAAARVMVGLGAKVTMLDISMDKLEHARAHLIGNVEYRLSNKPNIEQQLENCDLFMNCVPWPKTRRDHLVTREMIRQHAPKGLLIMDVANDVGGALETNIRDTSHTDPIYELEGIRYYTVDNIPAAFGMTAATTFMPVVFDYIKDIAVKGVEGALKANKGLRTGLTCYNGLLTLAETGIKQNRPYVSPEEALGMN